MIDKQYMGPSPTYPEDPRLYSTWPNRVPANYHFFLLSIGLAYALPELPSSLRRLTLPAGKTVFRTGYSISGVQDGMAVFRYVWGDNPGRSTNLSVDPNRDKSSVPEGHLRLQGQLRLLQPSGRRVPGRSGPRELAGELRAGLARRSEDDHHQRVAGDGALRHRKTRSEITRAQGIWRTDRPGPLRLAATINTI